MEKALLRLAESSAPPNAPVIEVPESPTLSHAPRALGIGVGNSTTQGGFIDFWMKPALHDRLSRSTGYAPHMHLDVFKLTLRHDETNNINVHSVDFIDMGALSPTSLVNPKMSWQFMARWQPTWDESAALLKVQGASGLALDLNIDTVVYSLVAARIEGEPHRVRMIPGLLCGIEGSLPWHLRAVVESEWFGIGDYAPWQRVLNLAMSHSWDIDLDIRLHAQWRSDDARVVMFSVIRGF